MKRIIVICLVALLLVTVFAMPALAADNFFFRGPDVVRAGDTITLTFYTGNLYNGVYGGSGDLVYDSEQLTLVKCTSMLDENWAVDFFGDHFDFADYSKGNPLVDNVPIFTAEFLVNENVPAGTTVSIAAGNVVLNNGNQDLSMGNTTWARVVAKPLSKNADLASLKVEGFLLSPAFAPEQQNYVVYLPYEVESLKLSAKVYDYLSTVEIPAVENIPVGRTDYEVIVTAQNGDTKVYTITTVRADSVLAPEEIPEETEPVTEPTEEATEPTEEATEPATEPTEETTESTQEITTETVSSNTGANRLSDETIGLLWIASVVAAFVGGFVAPMLIWNKD